MLVFVMFAYVRALFVSRHKLARKRLHFGFRQFTICVQHLSDA